MGLAGYFFYKYESVRPPTPGVSTAVAPNPPSIQPSNAVAAQNIGSTTPRVDTTNQPWYGGSQTFQNASQDLGAVSTGIASFWNSMDNSSTQKDPYSIQSGSVQQPTQTH